jgi:SAM-dependent methyltransferase
MGVTIIKETTELIHYSDSFDVIFASHVLEHLPSLRGIFEMFFQLLKPNGLLLVFVPNCGGSSARKFGVNWGPMCCEKHPLAFDANFFLRNLPDCGFETVSFSDPYPYDLRPEMKARQRVEMFGDGDELVVCGWCRDTNVSTKRGIDAEYRNGAARSDG